MSDLFPAASNIISAIALTVSVAAAAFSWLTAKHAKRQADAASGELDPIFSLLRAGDHWLTDGHSIELEITNHNRRPLLIHSIKLHGEAADTSFVRLIDKREPVPEEESERGVLYVFRNPARVQGWGINLPPARKSISILCAELMSKEKQLLVTFEWSFEGQMRREETRGITLFPQRYD